MTLASNREGEIQNELLNCNTLLTQYELENSELKIMNKNFSTQNKEYNQLTHAIKNIPQLEKLNSENKEDFKKRFDAFVYKKCETNFSDYCKENMKLFSDHSRI